MNIQTIEKTRPLIEKEAPQKDEEPPLPKPESKLLRTAMQKLIDGWIKMMDQGVAT
jgi:hypothetical protein